jgi:hypothetical protein
MYLNNSFSIVDECLVSLRRSVAIAYHTSLQCHDHGRSRDVMADEIERFVRDTDVAVSSCIKLSLGNFWTTSKKGSRKTKAKFSPLALLWLRAPTFLHLPVCGDYCCHTWISLSRPFSRQEHLLSRSSCTTTDPHRLFHTKHFETQHDVCNISAATAQHLQLTTIYKMNVL